LVSTALLLEGRASFAATSDPGPDGAALYARDCASCHRALAKTDLVGGRSASRIKSAIQVFGVMRALKNMTDDEIAAVAAVLAPSTQAGGKLVQQPK